MLHICNSHRGLKQQQQQQQQRRVVRLHGEDFELQTFVSLLAFSVSPLLFHPLHFYHLDFLNM